MTAHSSDIITMASALETDLKSGLSSEAAASLLDLHGPNKLHEPKKKTFWTRFFAQFKDVMILVLIAAAAVSFIVAAVSGHSAEFFEPALILLIVILNAVIGVIQESKAERALDALKSMSAPSARVIRGGVESVISASALVPGDVILVEAGDFVPADARLIESASLKCDESALTGESVPAEKSADAHIAEDAPLGDRANMIYTGCSVVYGRARAVVTATGMRTEMGRIANLLESAEDTETPLQKKLTQLGKYLGLAAVAACAVVFIVGAVSGIPILNILMTSIALAVSAIPEGLPAIVTVVLSVGVVRMARKNAIIRRLTAVETLGSASVICSDKTGTLTQNRMTLVRGWVVGGETEDVTGSCSDRMRRTLGMMALCCDAVITVENGEEKRIGDPTETAIIAAAKQNGLEKAELETAMPRVGELPFDSDRKLMTTVHRSGEKYVIIVKGALESLEHICVGDLSKAKDTALSMSKNALRVLGVACRIVDPLPAELTHASLEHDLTLLGLVGMIDPVRPEVKDSVALCRRAGIKPVMITGDQIVTATAIARELDIFRDGDLALTGAELSKMSDAELDAIVDKVSVYARVSPEDKIRIVRAWQHKGRVVSMTGDGVNDAPALKAADIGCAMGITGTDVAKNAADITLTDDNFTTIVDAVREGRGIYDNIKKVVGFLLGTNIGEVVCVFFSMLIWRVSPLLSMHLLLINLVTDSLPAIALGMEPLESDIMDRAPKPKNEGIFANGYGIRIALFGVMFGVLSMLSFALGMKMTGTVSGGQTSAFVTLAFSQVIHAFNMRSGHSLFDIAPFSNKKLCGAVLISLAVILIVVFFTPVASAFKLIKLSAVGYLAAFGLGLAPLPITELAKFIEGSRAEKR